MTGQPGLATLIVVTLLASGCASSHTHAPLVGELSARAPATRPESPQTAAPAPVMHYHYPGIAGPLVIDDWWCNYLDQGLATHEDCDCAMQVVDWFGGRRQIAALQAIPQNRATAHQIAAQIARRAAQHPGERIILTAVSGGCALSIWTLEDLPPSVHVDSLVMIAPALSRHYDLSRALAHVRGRAFVFTDPGDIFILRWGTQTFGTSDGLHSEAAGRRGFSAPTGAAKNQYAKLRTLPYRLAWLKYGNIGGHATAMSPYFGRDFIAPLVADDRPID